MDRHELSLLKVEFWQPRLLWRVVRLCTVHERIYGSDSQRASIQPQKEL